MNFQNNEAFEGATASATDVEQADEPGEGKDFQITNVDFLAAIFPSIPEGAFAAVCTRRGDPDAKKGWLAERADMRVMKLDAGHNNYLNCSTFYPNSSGEFRAKKTGFAACHFIMLDDIGTKVPTTRLDGFELSWRIETSPGNYQGGIALAQPITDGPEAVRLLNAVITAGLCDEGSTGPQARWARLPVAVNGKPKHADADGNPFRCRLVEWRPDKKYTPQEIVDGLQLELAPAGRPKKTAKPSAPADGSARNISDDGDDVLTPKAAENPVVAAIKARGIYKTPLGSGKHDVTCPWVHEHTDQQDNGAAYFEPDELYPLGGFCCQHSHGGKYRVRQFLEFLGVRNTEARHKATIRVVSGDLSLVVDAAEKELAAGGKHYQAGGLIVSVSTDPITGDPAIVPTSAPALTRELSVVATWERYDGRAKDYVRTDPPARHASVLYDSQRFRYLPPLAGLARHPYFREGDGGLVTQAGYDKAAQRFGVFDERQFVIRDTTREGAREQLLMLEDLLAEFKFVSPTDKAAALSAFFTAVVRTTLPLAPGFHVRAPVFGSGKTYLCELIGALAGPGDNTKISYPTSSEEATKAMLAALLPGPSVIEFDDMVTDWIPYGTINRMLTAEHITDRILGVSKTGTVSTRTLFLGSGNNVGPIRDLLRRVLTIHIDPRCATPATKTYKSLPVDKVRRNRGAYVSAILTIIQAWRKAGSPKTNVANVASYGGAWADYCRHPLIWLDQPDPATALLEQIAHDPDADALSGLLIEWNAAFGKDLTTVRAAVEKAHVNDALLDAMRECPVEERGNINPNKLGWFLRKSANRIAGGYEFQRGEADGRIAWAAVKAPASPDAGQ